MIKVSSSSKFPCGNSTTTDCVTWEGEDIVCLGIEHGEIITESIKKIAEEICALKEQLDLSDLDLKCLFDLCISCPEPEKTLHTVLELIINKICSLEEAINNISTSTTSGVDPILKLASCFQYTDADGDLVTELPHSNYTKRIAQKVCEILLDVSSIQDDIVNIQNDINSIQIQINGLETNIPDVTSDCLFTGTKSIEDAWDLLDQAFCQERTAVGLPTDINLALSRLCSDLNTEFSATPGWVLNPSNLAQGVNNLIIAFCAMREDVSALQDCCAATCDDVTIGFLIVMNDSRTEATIKFTSGAGTFLPTGFVDEGSTMEVTDQSGNTLDFNVIIANNGEEIIDLTGLNVNDDFTFNLTAKIANGSIHCQKCVSKKSLFANLCDFCEICVTGSTGTVTIIYEDNGSFVGSSFNPTTTTSTTTTTAP